MSWTLNAARAAAVEVNYQTFLNGSTCAVLNASDEVIATKVLASNAFGATLVWVNDTVIPRVADAPAGGTSAAKIRFTKAGETLTGTITAEDGGGDIELDNVAMPNPGDSIDFDGIDLAQATSVS